MATNDLLSRINAMKRKRPERRLHMNPCLTEGDVSAFELRWGVELPEDYRLFLLQVGNGGDGPPHYGLERLGEVPEDYFTTATDILRRVVRPFPLTEPWEGERRADRPALGEGATDGVLVLGTEGCWHNWLLVVTGAERGHVWREGSGHIIPCTPPMTFLDWYEEWLKRGP